MLSFNFYNREICGRLEAQTAKTEDKSAVSENPESRGVINSDTYGECDGYVELIISLFSPNNDT